MEICILAQKNFVLVGEPTSGKTSLMNQVVSKQMKRFFKTLL